VDRASPSKEDEKPRGDRSALPQTYAQAAGSWGMESMPYTAPPRGTTTLVACNSRHKLNVRAAKGSRSPPSSVPMLGSANPSPDPKGSDPFDWTDPQARPSIQRGPLEDGYGPRPTVSPTTLRGLPAPRAPARPARRVILSVVLERVDQGRTTAAAKHRRHLTPRSREGEVSGYIKPFTVANT
jgi:hypothetical protein